MTRTWSNLVLIGMPGSGKSTLGVVAAKALALDFADTDLLLQKRRRQRLSEILALGTELFLEAENELLAGLELNDTVIATGGSAVYHQRGMMHLKSRGLVLWIDVSWDEIEQRLDNPVARGVVLSRGQTLRDLHEERRPLYERWADVRLAVEAEPLETTAARLVQAVSALGL